MVHQSNIDPNTIKGIGFDATCSLAVFFEDTDEPVTVMGSSVSSEKTVNEQVASKPMPLMVLGSMLDWWTTWLTQ